MKTEIGKKYLVTTDEWFIAPDGEQYRAVFGTVRSIESDKDALKIATNRHSSNWYLTIGDMLIAGCQIHYVIRCDSASNKPPMLEVENDGIISKQKAAASRIFFADENL